MEEGGISAGGTAGGARDQTLKGIDSRIRGVCVSVTLRSGEFAAIRGRHQFVLTDSSEHNLSLTGGGIELPGAILTNQGDRERPVLSADVQNHGSVGLATKSMHLPVFLNENFALQLVLARVA